VVSNLFWCRRNAVPTLPGTDRLPAVVFVHGAGGIGFNYGMWAGELNKAGFATFVADSFTGRGITNTILDDAQLRLTR
jgi:dienelactone hydrolase